MLSQNVWKAVDESQIVTKSGADREIIPTKYGTFSLDFKKMQKALLKSPHEKSTSKMSQAVSLDLPLPDGNIIPFRFFESPCMSPVLAAKFPNIKSYRGFTDDQSGDQARIDFSPGGFHAVIKTHEGVIYIDPYFTESDGHYISYYVRDHIIDTEQYEKTCGIAHYENSVAEPLGEDVSTTSKSSSLPVTKRTYRLALACTAAWGSIFGSVESVMQRFNTGVNRLNMIFENELAIKFEMIGNNDQLAFIDKANEPYTSPQLGRTCLAENQNIINSVVGENSYDIGHVFTISCTDGIAGVAYLGSLCNFNKGGGVSCVGFRNVSNFMVQTTAHEIGHQLSGGHSWNSCPPAQSQFSSGTSWEPGSGSTILSYAGACGSDNIANSNDDYFHVGNIGQFKTHIAGADCGIEEDSGNNEPEIIWNYTNGFYIPISTPFELQAEATDIDGDNMTYNWEQMNTGFSSSLGSPMGNGPSFRSFRPDQNNFRIFPRLTTILFNTNDKTEVLPTYNRSLRFRFVVRDNHPGAGSMVWQDISFNATDEAGPFVVTNPSSDIFVAVNQELNVEWDVANTDGDLIDCQFVDIYLSTNGGLSFDFLLAEDTPNDGSENVRMPNVITNNAKVKVKASNNIFFNIARPNIIIREPSQPGYFIDLSENSLDFCLPEIAEVTVDGTSFQGFTNDVYLDVVSGLPSEAIVNFSQNPIPPDGSAVMQIDMNNVQYSGEFEVIVRATSEEADTIYQTLLINATGTNFDELKQLSPLPGTEDLNGTPEFVWNQAPNADAYRLEVSTDPSFGASNIIFEENISDTSIIPQIALPNSNLYYWRVSAFNKCREVKTDIRTFGTVSLSCRTFEAEDLPRNISASGRPTVSSLIEIFDAGTLSDVNVKRIKGIHQRIQDIKATLISPAQTEIVLFENRCFGSNFNLGFDNDSPVEFFCNLNNGIIMKPELDDLGKLKGEDIRGDWYLEIADTEPGEGGQFQEFVLELCSNAILDEPYLVNNNIMDVPVGFSELIRNFKLLVKDDNNTDEELIYTLVKLPTSGSVNLNGEALGIGDQFSQLDINNELLRYVHEGTEEGTDSFTFTVIDGEGGWVDLTEFKIEINDAATSVEDAFDNDEQLFDIFPNPANDIVYVYQTKADSGNWQARLYSLDGRRLLLQGMESRTEIKVRDLTSGLYLLELSSDEGHRQILKLSIQ